MNDRLTLNYWAICIFVRKYFSTLVSASLMCIIQTWFYIFFTDQECSIFATEIIGKTLRNFIKIWLNVDNTIFSWIWMYSYSNSLKTIICRWYEAVSAYAIVISYDSVLKPFDSTAINFPRSAEDGNLSTNSVQWESVWMEQCKLGTKNRI